jgi:hypothetical protein
VARDPHRHEWERRLATALLTERPDAIVVEMGLPNNVLQGRSRGRSRPTVLPSRAPRLRVRVRRVWTQI